LDGAKTEVNELINITSGKAIMGSKASEKTFVEESKNYQIIHLSSHAFLDNENPSLSELLFYISDDSLFDGHLTAYEICYLDLHAELVVLSACRTGLGKINRGEGVMSLGRAFSFAGVPATLMSLWKIPDQATAQIMPYFYESLRAGKSKTEALNIARKKYLEHTHIDQLKHPYYWGGFVLYGKTSSIQLPSNLNKRRYLFGLLLIFCIAFFIYQRQKSKRQRS